MISSEQVRLGELRVGERLVHRLGEARPASCRAVTPTSSSSRRPTRAVSAAERLAGSRAASRPRAGRSRRCPRRSGRTPPARPGRASGSASAAAPRRATTSEADEVEHGLVDQVHLAAHLGVAQLAGERHPPGDPHAPAAIEEAVAVASRALRRVHRAVGLADRLVRVGRGSADERDADARRDDRRLDPRQGLGDRLEQTSRRAPPPDRGRRPPRSRRTRRRRSGRRSRRRAPTADEALADLAEDLVGPVVAERVVERLEAVEVDEQHRAPAPRPDARPQRLVEALEDRGAVRQAGQAVVARVVDAAPPSPAGARSRSRRDGRRRASARGARAAGAAVAARRGRACRAPRRRAP